MSYDQTTADLLRDKLAMDDLMVRMAEALRIFALIQLGPQGYCSSFLAAHVERAKTTLAEYDRAAHLSGPAVAGWKLVPPKLTDMMHDAADCTDEAISELGVNLHDIYAAFLAAAPDAVSHTTGQEKG